MEEPNETANVEGDENLQLGQGDEDEQELGQDAEGGEGGEGGAEGEEQEDGEGEEVEDGDAGSGESGEPGEGDDAEGNSVQNSESHIGSQDRGENSVGSHKSELDKDNQPQSRPSKSQQDLDENQSVSQGEKYKKEEESNEDENADDEFLPPERKVRYRLFKFINKMRQSCHYEPYCMDTLANRLAMEYANYLLSNGENEEQLKEYATALNFLGEYKVSFLDSFVDSDNAKGGTTMTAKFNEYSEEFYDVQATLVEFEEHCENILSENFNKVGIGMAFNDTKVIIVNIFCKRDVTVGACSVNVDNGSIMVKGELTDESYGAYALRIINVNNPHKTVAQCTPQHITPVHTPNKIHPFSAVFNNIGNCLENPEPKNIQVFIRVKPDLIPYNKVFTDKIRFEDLTIGAEFPLENFPNEKEVREQKRQDANDEKMARQAQQMLIEYEKKKDDEKKRRMKIDGYAYAKEGEMGEIQEEPGEEGDSSQDESSIKKSSGKGESKMNQSKSDFSDDYDMSGDKSEHYERELNDLELTNERLKEDNELIQKKIKIIYDFRKKEGREDRNFYKESNINESTYADSLTSTAGLYNDLNSHKLKLDQDLKRYQQSIDEQEKRKQDVYEILKKYKQELLDNAETRKGTKIPRREIEDWLDKEEKKENEISALRISSFTKSLEMNRLKKELKKMEDYFEGLHIIDFEQLKIENNTLTEKIEDRNEEIHKLKNKINHTVQVLAHLQEKSRFVTQEKDNKKNKNEDLKNEIVDMKGKLTQKKTDNELKALTKLNKSKKIDQINSVPLKNYYRKTLNHIQELSEQIEKVSQKLMICREKRKATKKDILDLLQRKEKMMKDYKTLPKIDEED